MNQILPQPITSCHDRENQEGKELQHEPTIPLSGLELSLKIKCVRLHFSINYGLIPRSPIRESLPVFSERNPREWAFLQI